MEISLRRVNDAITHNNQTTRMIQMANLEEYGGNGTTITSTTKVKLAKRRHQYPKPCIRHQQESDGNFTYSSRAAAKSSDIGTDSGASHAVHPDEGRESHRNTPRACSSEPTQTLEGKTDVCSHFTSERIGGVLL
jgi:hypothetical protein